MWLLKNKEGGNGSYCSCRSVMLGFGDGSFATVNLKEICSTVYSSDRKHDADN